MEDLSIHCSMTLIMNRDGARGEGVAFLLTRLISGFNLVRPEALRVPYLNSYLSIGGASCSLAPWKCRLGCTGLQCYAWESELAIVSQ